MSKHRFPVINGGRADDAPVLRTPYSRVGQLGYAGKEDGEIITIADKASASVNEDAIQPKKEVKPVKPLSPLLKPVESALDRAFENGDKALLVFYDSWTLTTTMRDIKAKEGDPYAIYQDFVSRNPTSNLVLALDPSVPFRDQFPEHLIETLKEWTCFVAKPLIANDLFPVHITWGRHHPTGLPNPRPNPVR